MWCLKYIFVSLILFMRTVTPLENGLARTPPMGWMHWLRYGCKVECDKFPDDCVHENLFKRITDVLVKDGYLAAGYQYVIIDDCWMEPVRDSVTNKLVEDASRFPSGLKHLADYIHQKGAKFGLYENYGNYTCAGYPGVMDYMDLDAKSFAAWDVDYVKLDGCYVEPAKMDKGYPEFGRLLKQTGRPMVYSCSWPVYQEAFGIKANYEAIKTHCNLWRNGNDIDDSLESVTQIMDYYAYHQDKYQPNAGPGHWNDPDMLILGNNGLTYEQSKMQMAVWSILAAPLIMSNDLSNIKPEIKEILLNRHVIAIDQDPLGIQGRRWLVKDKIEVWTRPVSPVVGNKEYSFAVAFVNRQSSGAPNNVEFTLNELNLNNKPGYSVTDLYNNNAKVGSYKPGDSFTTSVKPTGVTFYKFTALN